MRNYLLDGLYVICEFCDSGDVLREYVPGVSVSIGGVSYYYHYERLGSVRFISDSSGNVVSEYVYDAWGNLVSSSGSISQPYQYLSFYSEGEIGLYLTGKRWYAPDIGRYISRNSPYVFSNNNPVSPLPVYTPPISDITTPDNPKEPPIENPLTCAKRISDEVSELKEPIEGDRWGLWKHCVASCRIVRECPGGWFTAYVAGWVQEIGKWDVDSLCDLRADAVGRGKAYSNKSCEEACVEAWEKGELPRCCDKK